MSNLLGRGLVLLGFIAAMSAASPLPDDQHSAGPTVRRAAESVTDTSSNSQVEPVRRPAEEKPSGSGFALWLVTGATGLLVGVVKVRSARRRVARPDQRPPQPASTFS